MVFSRKTDPRFTKILKQVPAEDLRIMVTPSSKPHVWGKIFGMQLKGEDKSVFFCNEDDSLLQEDEAFRSLKLAMRIGNKPAAFDLDIGQLVNKVADFTDISFAESRASLHAGNFDKYIMASCDFPTNALLHERIWSIAKKNVDAARKHFQGPLRDDSLETSEGYEAWGKYAVQHKLTYLDYAFSLQWALTEAAQRSVEDPYDYGGYGLLNTIFALDIARSMHETAREPEEMLQISSLVLQQFYHTLCHKKAGGKVYEVSGGLAAQLVDTELRGLTVDDIALPYESVCLVVPKETGLRVWNRDTEWHVLESIYIIEVRESDGIRRWRFLLNGTSKNPNNVLDDALVYFALDLLDNKKIDEIIEVADAHLKKVESTAPGSVGLMAEEWIKVFHWALNVIIYATWPDAEREHVQLNKEAKHLWDRIQKTPKGPKRDRLKLHYKDLDPRSRIKLGKSVVYISRDKAQLSEHGHHAGRPLTLRIRVQGHWKKQFHGPKRALRKLIWIQPYWKGPEDGVLGQAVHRLAGSSEKSTPPEEKESP